MKRIGIILLFVAMLLVVPAMATPCSGNNALGTACNPEHNVIDNLGDIDITIDAPPTDVDVTVPVTNNFAPNNYVDVYTGKVTNTNNNFQTNLNNNINTNIVGQTQGQMQGQFQTQANVQTVVVPSLPQDDSGILISNANTPSVVNTAQLSVGDSQSFSRLVYPGEVLTFGVKAGDKVSVISATDIGLYTIGWFWDDELKVASKQAIPTYNPITHGFEWGSVVPINYINYWTTKATLVAGDDAKVVVVDNRAPRNTYTHVEILIQEGTPIVKEDVAVVLPFVLAPSVYPIGSDGKAITS